MTFRVAAKGSCSRCSRKRSSEAPEPTPLRTHYRIRAYGQLFQLNLSADAAFLAAGYTEVHLGAPERRAEERSAAPPDLRHCFYRGQVNAREDHTAVFSLCGGLLTDNLSIVPPEMGTFKAHDGEYFLEPIIKADGSELEDDHNKPHLIYRQEFKRNFFLQSHKPCEVSESQTKKTTLPFHNYSNMNEDLSVKEEVALGYSSKNTSLEDERSQLHSRKKRFLSYPRYVEVMATADTKMVHHHGQNLQHYVLTLMSIVAAIYKDSSIGNLINIVIVKLVIIHDEQEGPVISFNAATTLRNFCLWQQTQNVLDDAHPSHHDTAVLITREDICGAREKCDTLGLAELGTLCDPLRSCSISEENGLSAAFTIAHELGHVRCVCKLLLFLRERYVHIVVSTGHGECLLDKPNGRIYDLSSQLPGLMYDVNKQCELMFGPGSQVCPYLKVNKPFFEVLKFIPITGKQDFREKQCSDFDGKHFNINGLSPNVRWLPKYSGIAVKDRCKLYCRVAGTTRFYQLKDRVADGTPCGTETNDICVQGLCRQAGCDHVLNSKARRDKCGVCGGDNSSCRTMAGVFNSAHYGYNVVVKIPPGATNIDILQHSYSGKPEDDNYLALSDTQGNFLLNGNFVVSMSKKEINVQGAIFEYSGSNNSIERINSTDRLEEELVLQVLCVGNLYNPDVRYSFNIPMEEKSDLFTWDPYGPWQDCTKMCQGLHRRKITCIRKSDHTVVSDQRCDHLPLPLLVTERCNMDCELRWHIVGKSECSSHCGQGYKSLDVQCMKYSIHKGQTVPVDDHYCSDQLKPPTREPCHGDCVLTRWHYSEWSQCTATCGQGYQMRAVKCVNELLSAVLDDRLCHGPGRPSDRQVCTVTPCPIIPKIGATSLPAVPMGKTAQWRYGSWTPCSVSCGRGSQARYVSCRDAHDGIADESYCAHVPRPAETSTCFSPCGEWQTGNWSPCSSSCAGGVQRRVVVCQDENGQSASYCDAASKPPEAKHCDSGPCPRWSYGSWGECTQTCGGGIKSRFVICQFPNGQMSREQNCEILNKPPSVAQCHVHACPDDVSWHRGPWKSCSVTCGSGVQQRDVYCQLRGIGRVAEEKCDGSMRPDFQRQCWRQDCLQYQWVAGEWPDCSTSCKKREMHRQVICMDAQNTRVNDSFCDPSTRPPSIKKCRNPPCKYIVVTGDSSQCAGNCGFSYRQRITYCTGIRSTEKSKLRQLWPVTYRECPVLPSPQVYKCNFKTCLHMATWKVGTWSECSVTCGVGIMERRVECLAENGWPSDLCLKRLKPDAQKKCYVND
ncbi:a disintegrin-like and metallopeptidase (reprolysin type) with thrombospondin type 1 motif, 20, partial [Camelus ferus]